VISPPLEQCDIQVHVVARNIVESAKQVNTRLSFDRHESLHYGQKTDQNHAAGGAAREDRRKMASRLGMHTSSPRRGLDRFVSHQKSLSVNVKM
jgi:hypothetical protein